MFPLRTPERLWPKGTPTVAWWTFLSRTHSDVLWLAPLPMGTDGTDGNCAYHTSSLLFFGGENATEFQVQECKQCVEKELLQCVLGAGPDGDDFALALAKDAELDRVQIAKLANFGLVESFCRRSNHLGSRRH